MEADRPRPDDATGRGYPHIMPWDRKLTRRLTLRDGRKIGTLKDAADVLLASYAGARKHAALEHAIELLMAAERSGKRADIEAATKQVALVLRQDHKLAE